MKKKNLLAFFSLASAKTKMIMLAVALFIQQGSAHSSSHDKGYDYLIADESVHIKPSYKVFFNEKEVYDSYEAMGGYCRFDADIKCAFRRSTLAPKNTKIRVERNFGLIFDHEGSFEGKMDHWGKHVQTITLRLMKNGSIENYAS